ncbi:MAG: polysaccharide biosynthesis protein [Nitrospina sp.]|jgi:UDP-N-acetylglucosamine 4,6-dehydratase|nr:polysaccharide biosynthesis protein [Nitrospina sp.]
MMIIDLFLVSVSLWLAFILHSNEWFWPSLNQWWLFISATVLALPIFINFGLYREVVRFIGHKGMLSIFQATGILVLLWLLVATAIFPLYFELEISFPRFLPILFWMTLLLVVGGSRQLARLVLLEIAAIKAPTSNANKSVLIYGAGRVGLELASSLSHNKEICVLGFIDDDHSLHGHFIHNLEILGDRTEIGKIRSRSGPLEVLLATPSMSTGQRKDVLKYLEDKKVAVRTVPSLNDFASGVAKINDLRNIDITDLLARKEVEPNQKLLATCITNKNVLVTGAGGSIGSELCRQIYELNPNCLVLFEHSELSLYRINLELKTLSEISSCEIKIVPILGSINNKKHFEETIRNFKIDTVYHAAAYKHVTLIENNISAGVRNNIFGTLNVAQAALSQNVKHFILISTDKAVRPTSVMGATKRIAEMIIQGLSQQNQQLAGDQELTTRFVIVRFGNVLGSSGSVIPLFQQQIAAGGPITITHPEATRYFMTISEASQLVIQAGSMGDNCSVFVLDMGDPVSILSLAKQMVYLSGHLLKSDQNVENDSGIAIKYTGMQKGEKIHEELFIGENITVTKHPMIMKAQEDFFGWSDIEGMLTELESQYGLGEDKMQQLLMQYAIKKTDDKLA